MVHATIRAWKTKLDILKLLQVSGRYIIFSLNCVCGNISIKTKHILIGRIEKEEVTFSLSIS